MKATLSALSVLFVLALAGCEAVFTEQPIGDEAVQLDPATWQGTWLSEEIVLLTTVVNAEKGQLQAAWVERGPDGARFEAVTGTVRRAGEALFLTMEHERSTEAEVAEGEPGELAVSSPEYFWARIENDGRRAILWWPNVEQFRLAVDEKKLPGVIKHDKDVVLGPLDAGQLTLIGSPASNLLQWSQPVTFIRVGD